LQQSTEDANTQIQSRKRRRSSRKNKKPLELQLDTPDLNDRRHGIPRPLGSHFTKSNGSKDLNQTRIPFRPPPGTKSPPSHSPSYHELPKRPLSPVLPDDRSELNDHQDLKRSYEIPLNQDYPNKHRQSPDPPDSWSRNFRPKSRQDGIRCSPFNSEKYNPFASTRRSPEAHTSFADHVTGGISPMTRDEDSPPPRNCRREASPVVRGDGGNRHNHQNRSAGTSAGTAASKRRSRKQRANEKRAMKRRLYRDHVESGRVNREVRRGLGEKDHPKRGGRNPLAPRSGVNNIPVNGNRLDGLMDRNRDR
jgi:hypothetical protein